MTRARQKPEQPLDALVALAVGHHRAGRLPEAAEAYRKILAVRPDIAEVHNDLGILLAQQGQLDQARPRFEQAIALKPAFVEAHNNLGNVLRDLGKLTEAAARFRQTLALRPDNFQAHNNLGNVLLNLGQLNEAAACFAQTIALRPDYAEAHSNLGIVFWRQGRHDEAAARFEQAIALRPDYAEAHSNLGIILAQQDKLADATARFRQALALRPDYAEAHNNLGSVLWKQDKLEEAAAQFEQALALRPNYAEAHNNLGDTLNMQGKFDQALAHFQQALALRPDYAEAHNNLSNVLLAQGKLEQSIAHCQRAIALRPDFADARLNLATCYLTEGDYERGWQEFEARLQIPGLVTQPDLPRWIGQPLAGRSLLLLAEQGLGDTIHFVRYARLLKERGARVVLAAQPALRRLLASHPDWDELFVRGPAEELPHCDFYLPLLSAPAALRSTAATLPRQVPYLWANPELTDHWRRELAAIEGFKIGIVWQGDRSYRFDRWRSIPLAEFAPLARLPGVRLISLQKGFGSEQIARVDFPVLDLSDRLDAAAGPFMDTAAVIRNLDLVVAPNTAIAHLAGALGVPIWLALLFSPDWRWLRGREDSPWYPTMRLFRQTTIGRWSDVFERIAHAVQARRTETA